MRSAVRERGIFLQELESQPNKVKSNEGGSEGGSKKKNPGNAGGLKNVLPKEGRKVVTSFGEPTSAGPNIAKSDGKWKLVIACIIVTMIIIGVVYYWIRSKAA